MVCCRIEYRYIMTNVWDIHGGQDRYGFNVSKKKLLNAVDKMIEKTKRVCEFVYDGNQSWCLSL